MPSLASLKGAIGPGVGRGCASVQSLSTRSNPAASTFDRVRLTIARDSGLYLRGGGMAEGVR